MKEAKKEKVSASDDKSKPLDLAIAQLEKNFGKGCIMKFSDKEIVKVDVISTGCIAIDLALGIGGIPKGRIIEIYGPESSGKTTLSLHAIAQAQKDNGVVAFIDAEHALDPSYAKNLGIDLANLYISQPDNGEQALDIVETLVKSNAVDLIVVDSVAALTPKAEIEGEMGENHIGLQARLMSQALRKLAGICNRTNTAIIFINQLREKVGVMFGSPEVTTGGKALKFYASIRMDVRKGEAIKEGTDVVGSRTKIKIVKNKLAPPFRVVECDIIYGKGISREGCIIDLATQYDILTKTGSWYNYNGERLGQGRENIRVMLQNNKELAKEIEDKIRLKALSNDDMFIDNYSSEEENIAESEDELESLS